MADPRNTHDDSDLGYMPWDEEWQNDEIRNEHDANLALAATPKDEADSLNDTLAAIARQRVNPLATGE